NVDLENCYGIKKLKTEFDFAKSKAYAIYAPNGAMKSSLARTFKDIPDKAPSKDQIFPGRVSKREITDAAGVDLPSESVLVVRPYDEVLDAAGECQAAAGVRTAVRRNRTSCRI